MNLYSSVLLTSSVWKQNTVLALRHISISNFPASVGELIIVVVNFITKCVLRFWLEFVTGKQEVQHEKIYIRKKGVILLKTKWYNIYMTCHRVTKHFFSLVSDLLQSYVLYVYKNLQGKREQTTSKIGWSVLKHFKCYMFTVIMTNIITTVFCNKKTMIVRLTKKGTVSNFKLKLLCVTHGINW